MLEAYCHYFDIRDYDQAGGVIVQSRETEWKTEYFWARTFYKLGELYRIYKDYETAINHHVELIEILEDIGSKYELAEAYYQLALTYQDMERIEESQENFNKAIQLFAAIEAPLQVKRVKQSIK